MSCSRRNSRLFAAALLASLAPLAAAGQYTALDEKLRQNPKSDAVALLRNVAENESDALQAANDGNEAARTYIALRARLEGASDAKLPKIAAPIGDDRTGSSWLSNALDRLRNLFKNSRSAPPQGSPGFGIGNWVKPLVWSVLIFLAGLVAFLLARYVKLPGLRRRKRIVEEEEEIRNAAAWLTEAEDHIAHGRYREAVRGLYVAGLLRFDEAGVARFDPHQTNWEHLRRIESSSKLPPGVEAREATRRFDLIWYGRFAASADDAIRMRDWATSIAALLREAAAA